MCQGHCLACGCVGVWFYDNFHMAGMLPCQVLEISPTFAGEHQREVYYAFLKAALDYVSRVGVGRACKGYPRADAFTREEAYKPVKVMYRVHSK